MPKSQTVNKQVCSVLESFTEKVSLGSQLEYDRSIEKGKNINSAYDTIIVDSSEEMFCLSYDDAEPLEVPQQEEIEVLFERGRGDQSSNSSASKPGTPYTTETKLNGKPNGFRPNVTPILPKTSSSSGQLGNPHAQSSLQLVTQGYNGVSKEVANTFSQLPLQQVIQMPCSIPFSTAENVPCFQELLVHPDDESPPSGARRRPRAQQERAIPNVIGCTTSNTPPHCRFNQTTSNIGYDHSSRDKQGNAFQSFSDSAFQVSSIQIVQDSAHKFRCNQIMQDSTQRQCSNQIIQDSTQRQCSNQNMHATRQPCSSQINEVNRRQLCSDSHVQGHAQNVSSNRTLQAINTHQPCVNQLMQSNTNQPCVNQSMQSNTYQHGASQTMGSTHQPCVKQPLQANTYQPYAHQTMHGIANQPYAHQTMHDFANQPYAHQTIHDSTHQPCVNQAMQHPEHQPYFNMTTKTKTHNHYGNQSQQVKTHQGNSSHKMQGKTYRPLPNNGYQTQQTLQNNTQQCSSAHTLQDNITETLSSQFIQNNKPQDSYLDAYSECIQPPAPLPYTDTVQVPVQFETIFQQHCPGFTNGHLEANSQKQFQNSTGKESNLPSYQPDIQKQTSGYLRNGTNNGYSSHQLLSTNGDAGLHPPISASSSSSMSTSHHDKMGVERNIPVNACRGNSSHHMSSSNITSGQSRSVLQDSNVLHKFGSKPSEDQRGSDSRDKSSYTRDFAEDNDSTTTSQKNLHALIKQREIPDREGMSVSARKTVCEFDCTSSQESHRNLTADPIPLSSRDLDMFNQEVTNGKGRKKQTEQCLNNETQFSMHSASTKQHPSQLNHTPTTTRNPQVKREVRHQQIETNNSGKAVGFFTGELLPFHEKAASKKSPGSRNTPPKTYSPKKSAQNNRDQSGNVSNGTTNSESPQISAARESLPHRNFEERAVNMIGQKRLPKYQSSTISNEYSNNLNDNSSLSELKPIEKYACLKFSNDDSFGVSLMTRGECSRYCTPSCSSSPHSTSPKTEHLSNIVDQGSCASSMYQGHESSTGSNSASSFQSESHNTCPRQVNNPNCRGENAIYKDDHFKIDSSGQVQLSQSTLPSSQKPTKGRSVKQTPKPQLPQQNGQVSSFDLMNKGHNNYSLKLSGYRNNYESSPTLSPHVRYLRPEQDELSTACKIPDLYEFMYDICMNKFSKSEPKIIDLSFACLENHPDLTDIANIEPTFFPQIPDILSERTHGASGTIQTTVLGNAQLQPIAGREHANIREVYINQAVPPCSMVCGKGDYEWIPHDYSGYNMSFEMQSSVLGASTDSIRSLVYGATTFDHTPAPSRTQQSTVLGASTDLIRSLVQGTPTFNHNPAPKTTQQYENNQIKAASVSSQPNPEVFKVPLTSSPSSSSTSTLSSTSQLSNDCFKKPFVQSHQSFRKADLPEETCMSVSQYPSVSARSDVSMRSDISSRSSQSANVNMSDEELNHAQQLSQQNSQQSQGQQNKHESSDEYSKKQPQHGPQQTTRHQEIYLEQQRDLQKFNLQLSEESLAVELSSGGYNHGCDKECYNLFHL